MVAWRSLLSGTALVWLLSGCQYLNTCNECWWYNRTSNQQLEKAVTAYEVGNYVTASSLLNEVMQDRAAGTKEKVTALKYLAFIHCISGKEKMCHESFKKALALDADFELTPAEVGHPIWGPVFRSAKGRLAR